MARRVRKSIADQERWNQMINSLRLMNFSFNNVRLYPPAHPEVTGPVTKLHQTLRPILDEMEDVGFGFMDQMLYLEGAMSIEETASNQMLVDRFSRCRVKYLTFMKGLTVDHLLAFFQVLNAEATKPQEERPDEILEKKGIQTIHIVEAELDDTASKSKAVRKKTLLDWYDKAVTTLKEAQEQIREGVPKYDLKPLFRLIDDMMATIRTKGYEPFLILPFLSKGMDPHACHSVNVGILSCALGELYGLNSGQISTLCICAFLHDAGRIEIPMEWTQKTGPLSVEERERMRRHSDWGFLWLMRNPEIAPQIALLAGQHHARFNVNSGEQYFPDIYQKIIAVADEYDLAAAGEKYYWNKQRPDRILKKILNRRGDGRDSIIVKLLMNCVGYYPVGSLVKLNDGQRGIVVRPNLMNPLRPKVYLFESKEMPVFSFNPAAATPGMPVPPPVPTIESEEPPPVILDLSDVDPLVTRFAHSIDCVLDADANIDLHQLLDKKKEYLLSHTI